MQESEVGLNVIFQDLHSLSFQLDGDDCNIVEYNSVITRQIPNAR
jgi:hypothetical protein